MNIVQYTSGLSGADINSIENYAKGDYSGYESETEELNSFLAYTEGD